MIFRHKVSKGSKFNQIYIPKEAEKDFEIGDLVEVKLLEKKIQLYYSNNLKHFSEFKENIIKGIFSILNQFGGIEQIYIFGSFLTKTIDYNDIDVLLVTKDENLKELSFNKLTKKINLKFHIISVNKNKLDYLIKICPLVRGIFHYCVSNKRIIKLPKREIEKNHIMFLLMMPEDILTTTLNSRYFYDSLRRLITIEKFLKEKEQDLRLINKQMEKYLDKDLIKTLINNEILNEKEVDYLRKVIKEKLDYIKRRL